MEFGADPKVGSGGDFLKLKDKEQAVVVFRGKPFEYSAKWDGKKTVKCEANEKGAGFRFRVAVIVKEAGVSVAKIWEQGATVYNQLKALNADYPLETTAVKITRLGSTQNDTSYTILPVPNGALTAESEAHLKTIELPDLSAGLESNNQTQAAPPSVNSADELPF